MNPISWFSRSPTLKQYKRYRKAGTALNHKIIEALVDDKVIEKAARALNLGKNRQLVLDTEDDLSVMMDYALHEIRKQKKNLVELYQEEYGGKNSVERKLLAARLKAKTGLFKVESVSIEHYSIDLRDLLDEDTIITLTDINFSQTMVDGLVVFFRPVELDEFTMTSGIAFVFPEEMETELKKRWEKWEAIGSAKRYARLFTLYKTKGLPTLYI